MRTVIRWIIIIIVIILIYFITITETTIIIRIIIIIESKVKCIIEIIRSNIIITRRGSIETTESIVIIIKGLGGGIIGVFFRSE